MYKACMRVSVLVSLLSALACSGAIVSPSTAGTAAKQEVSDGSTAVPTPTTPGPDPLWYQVSGSHLCNPAIASTGTLMWTFSANNAPMKFHLVTVSHHSDKAGCEPTTERAGPLFRLNPMQDYPKGSGGMARLTLNTDEVPGQCGRVQVDASIVFEDGTYMLIIGDPVNLGHDCQPIIPPPPPAMCVAKVNVIGMLTDQTGNTLTAVATSTIDGAVVSFVSYLASGATDETRDPQVLFAKDIKTIGRGSTTFKVNVPGSCGWWQADLVCGLPIDPIKVGGEHYNERLIAGRFGTNCATTN